MSVGFRVVRGPDWSHGNADHGEGHMGTIATEKKDQTCEVIWDMGGRTTGCRIGKDRKYDLRVLDNAPAGVVFKGIKCNGKCGKKEIQGMRWKCKSCDNYNLCSPCYVTGDHNLSHPFTRYNSSTTAAGVDVPMRGSSRKLWALGIFPGAKVTRGPHWDYGNQDGGKRSTGKVLEIRTHGAVGGRNAVKVKWQKGDSKVYRVGSVGRVEVQCLNEARGFEYYVDHLPFVAHGGKYVNLSSQSKSGSEQTLEGDNVIKVGDKVCVDIPPESLKEVHRGRGGWSMRMNDCIGEPMVVKGFPNNSTVEVEHEGETWQFYIGACRKIPNVEVHDVVKVLPDEKKVKLLQNRHGGWDDEMIQTLGKVGRVVKIDSDGDVVVVFGEQTWVYNAACLIPAPGAKIDEMSEQDSSQRRPNHDTAAEDPSNSSGRLMAQLLHPDVVDNQRTAGPEAMVIACVHGNIRNVQSMVKSNASLVNCVFKDLTPLMPASKQGYLEIVKFLVENGARVNDSNSENLTALLYAIYGKSEKIVEYLLSKGAQADVANKNGRSTAHLAVNKDLIQTLKLVLDNGCKPNRQDAFGDTPLHDAITKRSNAAVEMLLRHEQIDLTIYNKSGFTPILWAALKGHKGAVERLLAKDPSVVKQVKEDDSASVLHVAAVTNHLDIAKLLIKKGKADVNRRSAKQHTPLHLAAHEAHFEMTKLLLEYRANMDAQDVAGDTPLHVAMASEKLLAMLGIAGRRDPGEDIERWKTAGIMVYNGASLRIQNKKGNRPLDVCTSEELRDAVLKVADQVRPESAARARRPIQQESPEQQLAGLFSEMIPMPCALCEQRLSDSRLQPCGHKVTCKQCSVSLQKCPLCEQPVTARTDLDGSELEEIPCRVQ